MNSETPRGPLDPNDVKIRTSSVTIQKNYIPKKATSEEMKNEKVEIRDGVIVLNGKAFENLKIYEMVSEQAKIKFENEDICAVCLIPFYKCDKKLNIVKSCIEHFKDGGNSN